MPRRRYGSPPRPDREKVLDRIARTIATNRECRARADDFGIIDRFMPVLQGRLPDDYLRCADALHLSMIPGIVVGIGSMCRRDVHGSDRLVAVVDQLDRSLPAGVRLHLFGVKGSVLPWLAPYALRIASIVSQAWGTAARLDALWRGISKTDLFVAEHMERWTGKQLDRSRAPARLAPIPLPAPAGKPITDPWERAISRARAELRALIESGDPPTTR